MKTLTLFSCTIKKQSLYLQSKHLKIMISKRLLNKLQEGKKYLITNGIGFYLLEKKEDCIWCSELGWSSNGLFSIYMKSWEDILDENRDDNDFFYKVKI